MNIVTLLICFCVALVAYANVANVETNVDGTATPSGPSIDDFTKAVSDQDSAALLEYIKSGGNLNTVGNIIPLIYAAVRKFEEGVVTLIESGADVDIVEGDGWSTMMFCAHSVRVKLF